MLCLKRKSREKYFGSLSKTHKVGLNFMNTVKESVLLLWQKIRLLRNCHATSSVTVQMLKCK